MASAHWYAQAWAQSPADVYEPMDAQRDTAGRVILHQQYLLLAIVDDVSSSVAMAY